MTTRYHDTLKLLGPIAEDDDAVTVRWVTENVGALTSLPLVFEFPDPITTGDFVEVTVTADCTIPADLAGAEYEGMPETDDMHFELTEEPSGDVLGEVEVAAGNVVTLSGIGGEIADGTTLRMTATNIVGGSVSPGAIITIAARKTIAPAPAGRFEFTQSVASTTWTISHQLGERIVSVQVVSDAGDAVWGDVNFDTTNRCILTFSHAITGTAVIRR